MRQRRLEVARAGTSSLFEAIVFDLDGVLVDTELIVFEVWARTFAEFECAFSLQEWCLGVGSDSGFDPWQSLASRSPQSVPERSVIEAITRAEIERRVATLGPRPGVVDWLNAANSCGLAIAVASSSPRPWVEARLSGANLLSRFEVIVCRDAHLPAKPAPDLYLAACAHMRVDPARTVAIEDSLHGLAAARRAGMSCVIVHNQVTSGLNFERADVVLASMDHMDLVSALSRIEVPRES